MEVSPWKTVGAGNTIISPRVRFSSKHGCVCCQFKGFKPETENTQWAADTSLGQPVTEDFPCGLANPCW